MKILPAFAFALVLFAGGFAQPAWQAGLDGRIAFYQMTDFGIVLAGTERSLNAIDGATGERLWRRDTGKINETAITPVPDTDMLLFTRDLGSRSRLAAVDLFSGGRLWKSEKVRGDVLQLAADPELDLLAVVVVRNTSGRLGSEMKRTPVIHMLRLSDGEHLWRRELDSDVEMMPAAFGEEGRETAFTLDNYRPPLLLDGRLYVFYEGLTSYDARTGDEKERERFKVNEGGLALTEADPIVDDQRIYVSGRGRIRAMGRSSGKEEWKADDLGTAAEMALLGDVLYVRTGGQFTRLKDGETETKGPFGVSAIDTRSGKVLWRYKGADKGITNFTFADESTIVIADRDDLIYIDARTGKSTKKFEHKVRGAQFVLLNERREVVVGGRDTLAAFRGERETWRVRHKAPDRGVLRLVTGIALRAVALYFRYGGLASTAFNIARTGGNALGIVRSLRWSGLRKRFGSLDLTTLASNSARDFLSRRIYTYGSIAEFPRLASRIEGLAVVRPSSLVRRAAGRALPSGSEVRESILDRLDPVRQAERLSDHLLRRERLAELRGRHMYFFTDLPRPADRRGLIGVNIHTGRDERRILISEPDPQFFTDESLGLLYSADGDTLRAYRIVQ
ncbi:MAG: PQQ-binding-like beta-propeller repeat protein [Acidobacteria bacterium]|nr:PQQ-binding-like beta-propeller repeat protein [Acidobacteriota bacterium]